VRNAACTVETAMRQRAVAGDLSATRKSGLRARTASRVRDAVQDDRATGMVAPARGIAVLRIVLGLWFLKAVATKLGVALLWGVIPYPVVAPRFLGFHPKRVAEFAAGNPVGWYKDFLEGTVLPHATTFATLQTYGEVAVGLGLVLGAATVLSAAGGLFLTLNYGLATQWMSVGQQGFHVLLITGMAICLLTRAGRVWGIDALLRSRARTWAVVRWVT
jgi:thiosulfate dehydrogenase (quinone) large subunit